MKKVAIVAGLAGLLLFSGTALADESTKKEDHSGHGTTQVQPATKQEPAKTNAPIQTPATAADAQAHNMTTKEHKNMNMNMKNDGQQEMNMTSDEHGKMNMSEGSGGHGNHENIVETPANIPVLSTFAAINAAFLLFGVWNKWFRKKEALA